jgi:HK97 family phage major capsid protein
MSDSAQAAPEARTAPPAGPTPDQRAAAEKVRRDEIIALGEMANCRDVAVQLVLEGKTIEEARGAILLHRGGSRPLGNPPSALGLSENEAQRYSLFRAVRAVSENDWSKAGFELECSKALEKRAPERRERSARTFFVPLEVQERPNAGLAVAPRGQRDLTAGTGSQGGFLVATQNMSFIEVLRNRSVVMAMGATRMSGLVGNVTVPRQTGAGTAYWLSTEATAITEGDQVFAQMSLTPKNVGAYTEVSRQLLMQSDPSAEMVVMNDLARVVGIAVDAAAINGSGASGQPTGIVNTGSIGSVSGTSIAYAGILEFQTDVLAANALINPATAGYVCPAAVASLLAQRQRFTSTDTPLWQGNLLDGEVVGFRAMSSAQVAASRLLFGDFSQLVIGEWGVLEVEANPYANFAAGITGIRAFYSVDVGVRYAASFSYSTAIT